MLARAILTFLVAMIFSTTTASTVGESSLRLATTTSTANSGLIEYLLPKFTEETSIEAYIIAVGTGKALQLGRNGDVDLVLVHAKSAELAFIDDGFGVDRADVMYNDFVIIGPSADPVGIRDSESAV